LLSQAIREFLVTFPHPEKIKKEKEKDPYVRRAYFGTAM
jgi:hypothetical protein